MTKPCVAILDRRDGALRLTLANPGGEALKFKATLTADAVDETLTHTFHLPGGERGGQSVIHAFEPK